MLRDEYIGVRNACVRVAYRFAARPLFFVRDPERVHDSMVRLGRFLGSSPVLRAMVASCFSYGDKRLWQTIAGIHFPNPVGLAAGFDKNAELIDIIPAVGFGFIEVGSVTGEPCTGNPKPRLWRLKRSRSIAVYYGLKNDGCETIAARLRGKKFRVPVGISIAKTNSSKTVDVVAGIADYTKAYRAFRGIGDYDTINISCPNAYGGEPFTDLDRLAALLAEIKKARDAKPLFLKFSPDTDQNTLDALIDIASRYGVDGFVCTNVTKQRRLERIRDRFVPEKGGLSGKLVDDLSDAMIAHVYRRTKGRTAIIGVGGIFSAEDAYRKIRLGASLVQLITGMIFEGPQLISDINIGLVRLLARDGFGTIAEARGADIKQF